ncbi:uncharacterized protein RMCC_1353 [Mycolicibacterium canariasense]|uniref:Uncharacterized protein n=1 Tax=Mycolicibacterium canariasense TaxID=228230 RepID=A0A100W9J7_MYCCR|nr:uncharacterized protein RMCC_1353 [Mycolicibacterium canariasense]
MNRALLLIDIADKAAGTDLTLATAMGWTRAEYVQAIHNALRSRCGLTRLPAAPAPASAWTPPRKRIRPRPIRARRTKARKLAETPVRQQPPLAHRPLPSGRATVCRTCWLVHAPGEGCGR